MGSSMDENINSLVKEQRESEPMCAHLHRRLAYLRATALPNCHNRIDAGSFNRLVAQLELTITHTIAVLRKYSSKKGLQRVAARRRLCADVTRMHHEIDALFRATELADVHEMHAWQTDAPSDEANQLARLSELVNNKSNPRGLVTGLSDAQIEEALTEILVELTLALAVNAGEATTLLEQARDVVTHRLGYPKPVINERTQDLTANPVSHPTLTTDAIISWFISRDDVELRESLGRGTFGEPHRATLWNADGSSATEVCVKVLFLSIKSVQDALVKELPTRIAMDHRNIVPMLGACHVGAPMLLVSKLAAHGNLATFVAADVTHQRVHLWPLLLDAAQGLAFLHDQKKVHGSIKCSNILIDNTADNNNVVAQLSDFGFSDMRTDIVASVKDDVDKVHWKAPERLTETGSAAERSVAADIYALGMTIIEAKTGKLPWSYVVENLNESDSKDDALFDAITEEDDHKRPEGVFTDAEWTLVQNMTKYEATNRMPLDEVIAAMYAFAQKCPGCNCCYQQGSKFCDDCGCRVTASA